MRLPRAFGALGVVALAAALAIPPGAPQATDAASHREAPLISLDPAADITDFFMFRSYEAGNADKVVLVMNVIPGEEPSSGPNYFLFDPNVRYAFNIDNDLDGVADDVVIEVQFSTEIRGIVDQFNLFLGYVGGADGLPPITALDGPGSEGLGLRQHYTVTMVRKGQRQQIAGGLIAVPSNVGPRTMPNYDALTSQGIYSVPGGGKVYAGQRDDPFYIDLGAIFDTLNLRRSPPLETAAEDANDSANPFGTDMLSGFNVNTIAIDLPASMLTKDGQPIATTSQTRLGAYASTSRRKERVLTGARKNEPKDADLQKTAGPWVQIQRLANPLINEAIIGTGGKDEENERKPEDLSLVLGYKQKLRRSISLQVVYGVPAATAGRDDLVDLLLKYNPTDAQLSELLRVDLSVAPTPFATQRRLTVLAGDTAGWPNGRRPKDDVTDIAVRVVGGTNYINARAGDGVNTNDKLLSDTFPFLATPWDGRNRVHQNGS